MTQFFVGIVPPNDYKEKIIEFQKKWKSNHMWKVVEPHITVKAQSGLGPTWFGLITLDGFVRHFPESQYLVVNQRLLMSLLPI
jgi:hypothetical protein